MKKPIQNSIVVFMLMALTACSPRSVADGLSVMMGDKQAVENTTAYQDQFVEIPTQTLVYDEGFDNGGYYYVHLSDQEKGVYQVLYTCLKEHTDTCDVSQITNQQINRAYKSIIFDHPEIFYVDGYQLEQFTGDPIITFRPNYTKTVEEIPEIQARIDQYAKDILKTADRSSTFGAVRSIYDYVITHTQYNVTASELSNLCSVVINGEAVCDGYSKAIMYFCNLYGIDCIVVPGYIRSTGTSHLWNAVKIDGMWYFLDATWGDEDFENDQRTPEVRYDYLCVSEDQLSGTHQFEDFIAPPMCTSTDANYYYQTGRIVTACDPNQLVNMFVGIETNTSISFACSDQQVYQQVEDFLISNKHVFDFLSSRKLNVGFVTNPNVMSFTFWIRG